MTVNNDVAKIAYTCSNFFAEIKKINTPVTIDNPQSQPKIERSEPNEWGVFLKLKLQTRPGVRSIIVLQVYNGSKEIQAVLYLKV